MPYSLEVISTILTLSGIIPENIILEPDFSSVFLSHQYPCANKKICFLWRNENFYSAVVLDFWSLNNKVQCWLVGEAGNSLQSLFLIKQLQQAYSSPKISWQPLDAKNDAENKGIVFTEYLLQLLRHGKIKTIDAQKSSSSHHQLCTEAAAHQLGSIKIQNPEHYKKIVECLGVLWKYSALKAVRSTYRLTDANLELLEKIQHADEQTKKRIYGNVITEIEPYIEKLSLVMLVDFLRIEDQLSYIKFLQQEAITQLNDIKTWELKLSQKIRHQKNNFKDYLIWLGNKTATNLHQYSFIGLSAELAQWLSNKILNSLEKTTAGEYLLPNNAHYINKKNLIKTSKIVGGIVGIGFTYAAGSYAVGKSLFTNFLGLRLKDYFAQDKINRLLSKLAKS